VEKLPGDGSRSWKRADESRDWEFIRWGMLSEPGIPPMNLLRKDARLGRSRISF